jgi:putative phosphoserine phosphatase/1-acylglycerol-3-phosphate O-acyltransferase
MQQNTDSYKRYAEKSVVFIDVDLTLISCESFRVFILNNCINSGFYSKLCLAYHYFLRRLGRITISQFKERCLSLFKGMKRSELENLGTYFCQNILLKQIRPGARRCLEWHSALDIKVYLLSTSIEIYVGALANLLNLSGAFATKLKFDEEDRFTGEFDGRELRGEDKLTRIKQFCGEKDIDLSSSYFYTDSYEDLPLLKSVGFPIAVWPDNRLMKVCKQKHWFIEYW